MSLFIIKKEELSKYKELVNKELKVAELRLQEAREWEYKNYYSLPFYKKFFKWKPYRVANAEDEKWWLENIKYDLSYDGDVYIDKYKLQTLMELKEKYVS